MNPHIAFEREQPHSKIDLEKLPTINRAIWPLTFNEGRHYDFLLPL